LGYLATSGAKSDVILCDAISYKGDKISHLVFEMWCGTDRQTDDRCYDQSRRLLHLQYASL